jgi:hypothetical protein
MCIELVTACGTTYTAPSANSWVTGSYIAAPGQVNGIAATSDTMRIAGFIVLPGIEAPSAARSPLIMRPYDQELLTCQRYLRVFGGTAYERIGVGPQVTATTADCTMTLSPTMRAVPTFTPVGGAAGFSLLGSGGAIVNLTAFTLGTASTQMLQALGTVTGGLTAGHSTEFFPNNTTARLLLDARL